MSADPNVRRSRRILLTLLVLFFGSLAGAALLYYSGFQPGGSTSHGELVQPVRPLPETALLSAEDQTLDATILRSKWSLAYVGPGGCDARCREALTMTRQVRLALGKDSERVQRVFFVTGQCCDLQYLRAEQPDLITARLDEDSDRELLALFPGTATQSASEAGRIYIIDPLGNLMMSYERGVAPKGMLEDLKKLLKLSRIG
jgi:cytochrome oxidase Cu insertion factor (SCO1/SenC/PrrC family)